VHPERHRAPRRSFSANIELMDLQSERLITANVKDLSLFGCFVEIATPFPEGTKVRLRIVRGAASVVGLGKVAYARPRSGMGIHFTSIEASSQPVLDRWLASLR
jgi:hypothetical protein